MKRMLKLGAIAVLAGGITVLAAPVAPALAADDYPSKVVRCVVPFGAGGGTDRWARIMSSVGFDFFKSGMRVQNRGGADGTVGWKYMLDKGADGHTILLASPTPIIAALLEKKPPFDPAKVKIAAYYSVMKPTLMAPKGKPYSSWEGLVKYLKGSGRKLTIGGTIAQTLGPASILNQLGLIDRVILVPYSGTGKTVSDFLDGHIDLASVTTSTATTLTNKAVAILNSTDIDYPKKAARVLGKVPNARTLGLKPFTPPRFIAMHPDTPDAEVAIMSKKLGEMLSSKPVKDLIGKLNEDIFFLDRDKAAKAYAEAVNDSKKYLPLFK